MKTITSAFFLLVLLLAGNVAFTQTRYVNSSDGVNLRSGPGASYTVITTLPHNSEVRVLRTEGSWTEVEYRGQRGYVSSRYLAEQRTSGNRTAGANQGNRTQSSTTASGGDTGYTTGLGLRGGLTSGITFKHFVRPTGALEFILGSRWHGMSLSGLYEWHSPNAFDVPGLSWVYGIGLQIGFYDGQHYYYHYRNHPRRCNNPNDPWCYEYWKDRSFTAYGLVGIGGLEYRFRDIPFTLSFDLLPYFHIYHWQGNFIDGSFSLRYIIR
jgi:uncharacterized protein YraI